MSYLKPDTTEEQRDTLEAAGWGYVADSWGRSVYWHPDNGQKCGPGQPCDEG
jgi:hypothetical protein